MGYTKEQLLTRLKELEINFGQHEHPVVLTVEAALKYLANVDGTFCKNLFLKDKKHRFYIISALPETKVDMKVLSVRLGLGKGGLRMAPEEALGEILQVPLGCVTPFAVVNESARHVSLLLDQGLKSQRHILFHPLSNDMSIALSYVGLDKFLNSLGRDPVYVDLEANPPVGKDQPPDLAAFAPSNAIPVPESAAKAASIEVVLQNSQSVNSEAVKGKAIKQPVEKKKVNNKSDKGKTVNSVTSSTVFSNPQLFVDEILDKTSALVLSEVKEIMSKHGEQVADIASDNIQKRLHAELSHLVVVFKNTAYTEGFNAGTSCHGPRL